tara:strand:- start:152 stop:865 length:714 start_codon:yes stop_codon:yes gene_type:complete
MIFSFLKNIALFLFDLIDLYYHQKNIKNFLNKEKIKIDVLFDVGSHMGTYTDLILRNNNNLKAYLFEPQSKIFERIKKKYKDNDNILTFNLGVSDEETTKELFINLHDLTSTFSDFNKKSKYLNLKAKLYGSSISNMSHEKETVKTITLDKFILENNLESIDLMKIDTEGHELKVIKGLEKKIDVVKNILIEFHHRDVFSDYNPEEIHNFLINHGFKLTKVFNFPFSWQDRFYSKKS